VHLGVPGYLGIPRNFARLDYVLHAHEVDAGGIRLGNTSLGPRDVLYLMPEHHFPQCVTLDDARREAILEHSVRRDVVVVEDYYDSEFYYDHQLRMALKGSSAGRKVVYLGIFSKIPFQYCSPRLRHCRGRLNPGNGKLALEPVERNKWF
jgi:GntR family transcriptional regulator / MocR family aminotransferase